MVTLAVEYLHGRFPPVTLRDIKPDVSFSKNLFKFKAENESEGILKNLKILKK